MACTASSFKILQTYDRCRHATSLSRIDRRRLTRLVTRLTQFFNNFISFAQQDVIDIAWHALREAIHPQPTPSVRRKEKVDDAWVVEDMESDTASLADSVKVLDEKEEPTPWTIDDADTYLSTIMQEDLVLQEDKKKEEGHFEEVQQAWRDMMAYLSRGLFLHVPNLQQSLLRLIGAAESMYQLLIKLDRTANVPIVQQEIGVLETEVEKGLDVLINAVLAVRTGKAMMSATEQDTMNTHEESTQHAHLSGLERLIARLDVSRTFVQT